MFDIIIICYHLIWYFVFILLIFICYLFFLALNDIIRFILSTNCFAFIFVRPSVYLLAMCVRIKLYAISDVCVWRVENVKTFIVQQQKHLTRTHTY